MRSSGPKAFLDGGERRSRAQAQALAQFAGFARAATLATSLRSLVEPSGDSWATIGCGKGR